VIGLRSTPRLFSFAVLAVLACGRHLVVAATPSRPCSDPCFQAAQASFRDCVSSARGVFLDAVDGCLERDHTCVDACRSQHQECRDSTGSGAELLACSVELAAKKAECRSRFRLGSERRENCIDRAQLEGFRCRREVGRRFRSALRDCRQAFDACAGACGPGGPPGGPVTCRAEGKSALETALAECRQTFQTTARACFNKDVSCVQDCADARNVCAAPTQATLDAALAACLTQEGAAIAACRTANPAGGAALQQCVTAAQADAFSCRDAALDASAPGFADCAGQYVLCVRACPAP
jgi:hypothetical protein